MKLILTKRASGKKSEVKKIRRNGDIPAIVYSKGKKGKEVVINGREFKKIVNSLAAGTLSSKVFTLELEDKQIPAIIKEIQYAVTGYDLLHIDFEQLHDSIAVTVNIPVRIVHAVECVGVKLGGTPRQVIRYLKVSCLPANIPQQFEMDIKNLGLGQSKKLNELTLPKNVHPKMDLNQVAVVIARK